MKFYLQEMARGRRGLILWCLCQAALIGMGYLEFALVFRGQSGVSAILKEMPPAFMGMMGVPKGTDFSVVGDFFLTMADFGFYVMAAYASFLGFGMVSREEMGKTVEFLLTKPISRRKILLRKYAAGLTCCIIMGAVTGLVTSLTFGLDPDGDLLLPTAVWAGTSLILELVYFLAGAMFAAVCKKPSRGAVCNMLFLFGSIVAGRVIDMAGLAGPLLVLGPRHYFPLPAFVREGTFGLWPWVVCAIWCVLFTVVALRGYERRDF